ncbi:ATP-dependent DNA ligase [Halovivax sp.]|uniref:ATP-dependent DNA ligase n=1 Tax=Halovivax sp. TaxID=1935978 RepID=UPI0025BE1CAD|nr:ATP-dependent DNA ligase [Halovivax sp.]
MEFAAFADRAREIEDEPADLEIVDLVAELFGTAGDDLPVVARFVQGRVFPAWSSRKLDVGPSACHEAIARAAGRNLSRDDVESRLAEIGEIGDVAASYDFGGQQGLAAFASGADGSDAAGGGELAVADVDETLCDVAAAGGSGSQDRKVDLLFGLFNRCSPDEARYLARLVLEEMRIGVGEGTVRDAIAGAFDVPVEDVERALQVSNDYGHVAEIARAEGDAGLEAVELEIGRPVQAMLAQAGSVTEALEAWPEAAVEWKYDGARIQLHCGEPFRESDDGAGEGSEAAVGEIGVFSRNMEDVTAALPEVVEFAEETLDVPAILDGEVVAIEESGDPLPFQEVLRRFRRKHDVAKAREDVEVRPVFFDCLHADGDDLLDQPLTARHDRLERLLRGGVSGSGDADSGDADSGDAGTGDAGDAVRAADDSPAEEVEGLSLLWITDDPDEIESIDAEALDAGHEGIMLKDPGSAYSPGRRGKQWLKRKPDVETLDLVVTGAEWGEGRRATFLGTFELSVRDGDDYATIGKVATGISDEQLAELTDLLEPHVEAEAGQEVDLDPAVVFEVGYEEIQRSPTYESGYALRFPRFVTVRDDLDPQGADTVERVERLAGE